MNRDARYLQWALGCLTNRNGEKEEYLRYTRNACTLLATSGLAMTAAFYLGKGKVHKKIIEDLNTSPFKRVDLTGNFANLSTRHYMEATREVRKALTFLKRAAEIASPKEDSQNDQVPAEEAQS